MRLERPPVRGEAGLVIFIAGKLVAIAPASVTAAVAIKARDRTAEDAAAKAASQAAWGADSVCRAPQQISQPTVCRIMTVPVRGSGFLGPKNKNLKQRVRW